MDQWSLGGGKDGWHPAALSARPSASTLGGQGQGQGQALQDGNKGHDQKSKL
jgi:hypothetical protein